MNTQKDEILYKKIGKKYVPVGADRFVLPHGPGCYLVTVDEGCTSIVARTLEPAYADLEVAIELFRDRLCTELYNASRYRPAHPLTDKEKEAFAAYAAIMGSDSSITMTAPSLHEVVTTAVKQLRDFVLNGKEGVEVRNHGFRRLAQLDIPVYRHPAGAVLYVTSKDLSDGLARAGLSMPEFARLFGVQTCIDRGLYPGDVEAVLERMLSGKKTGTQSEEGWD